MPTISSRAVRGEPEQSATTAGAPPGLWLSVLIAVVLVGATSHGLFVDGAYTAPPGVRESLPATLRGQDLVTLAAVPVLIWSALRARAGSLHAHVIWLAILLYVAYTYLMYVVVPFNDAFVLYVAAIGLASYGLGNGLLRIDARAARESFGPLPRRALAAFLIGVGSLFAALWLGQILAAFPGGVPEGLFVYDIPSTVHVLDLAYILPLVIGTGILVLRRHPMAEVLVLLVLVKMLTLGLALLSMQLFVRMEGGGVDLAETTTWGLVASISLVWLAVVMRHRRTVGRPWLHHRVWATADHRWPGESVG